MSGTVYDRQGARIPGTVVKFINIKDKKVLSYSDEDGVYRFEMPTGVYKIVFMREGFKPLVIKKYFVVSSDSGKMLLDVVLEPSRKAKIDLD